MPLETQLSELFYAIEGGKAVEAGSIVQFPVDAGATALEGVTETVELGNGIATEVSQLTAVEGGATTTAGVGIMAVDVGVAGAALAPALGILAGVGLYNLTPDFWDDVANRLMIAGETIGGKVRAFLNGENQTFGISETAIEVYKNALLEAGLFAPPTEIQTDPFDVVNTPFDVTFDNILSGSYGITITSGAGNVRFAVFNYQNKNMLIASSPVGGGRLYIAHPGGGYDITSLNSTYIYDNKTVYYAVKNVDSSFLEFLIANGCPIASAKVDLLVSAMQKIAWIETFGLPENENLQEGAIYPTESATIPQTYPTWTPYTLPDEVTKVYPLTLPLQNPDATQDPAQNPDPLPDADPASALDFLINNLPLPAINPNPEPTPVPVPDPDPQPEPDPIEDPTKPSTDPNPVDPNPDPSTPVLPIVPDLPASVPANAMFTVYAPTLAQVNSFGGWLWDNNIIEQIKRIWNNPLEGIISFMKVYATPTTSGSDTIKVGILDSGVTSAVVSNQFVTVDCGTINILEKFYNATDYSPFVALHLYLPFIGIVELDCDEFMNGSIKVVYHIDVYTGTCLAEVKAIRSYDMPNATIIYTFSGNASQQLPLTSAEFSGAISALVGVVGGGLAIASGGGLGLLAGASGIAHAVTHEMVHIAHSGSLSANAGIMGARKPFLILTRRRSYDANGYNQIYGYPSNKTVYLNNCSGLVRVKDIQLTTGATGSENAEIETLLKSGVIM